MTCSNCQQAIEKHLRSVEGVTSVQVSIMTNKALVEFESKVIGIRQIIEEVEMIGFEAEYES